MIAAGDRGQPGRAGLYQPAVAERVVSRGGDYLITLKGNRRKAHAEVRDWFAADTFALGAQLSRC